MAEIQQALARAAQAAAEEQQQERSDAILKYQTKLFDSASAYTKLILGLGYGGLFTTWSFTRSYLTRKEVLLAALPILFSLCIYILFEILQMITNAKGIASASRLVSAPINEFEKTKSQLELEDAKRKAVFVRFWHLALLLTIVPGLFGAGVLLYAFLHHLLWK